MLLAIGGGVLLAGLLWIVVGLGFSGSSTNDKVFEAYERTLAHPESNHRAVRADALELAKEVCRPTPTEVSTGALDSVGASFESQIAVAGAACPDVAAALGARHGLPAELVSKAFCKVANEYQALSTTAAPSTLTSDQTERIHQLIEEMRLASPPSLQSTLKRLNALSMSATALDPDQQAEVAELVRRIGPSLASCDT